MEIKFLLLKILLIYIFKMAANGGHHFEINTETNNYKIKNRHTHALLTNMISVYYANTHFMELFHENYVFRRIY